MAFSPSSAHIPAVDNRQTSFLVQTILSIANLSKTYTTGSQALKNINLDIRRGEIFALLGPTPPPLHRSHEPANIA